MSVSDLNNKDLIFSNARTHNDWLDRDVSDEILKDGSAFGLEGVGFGLTVGTIMNPGVAGTFSSEGEFFWGGAASTIFWVDRKNNVTATMMTQFMPSDRYPIREDLKTLLYSSLSN